MKDSITALFCFLVGLSLSSCAKNPADDVDQATVENVSNDSPSSSASSPPSGETKVFVFTNSTKIEWTGSKVTGSHSGGFGNFVGKFEVADGQLVPGGKHFVTIDMASVFSDNERLTNHLKGEDFFDVIKFPIARFQLQKATPTTGDNYDISGILDMHGVAKKITFPGTLTNSAKETLLDMSAEFSINRKDFGITFPGKPDDLIRDEVVMNIAVNALPGEPAELVLMDTTDVEETQDRPGGGKGGKGRGKGGKGADWRNLSEEERQERRQQFINDMDTNKDGQLGKDELPERMWAFLGRADKDGDDKLSEQERSDFRDEMRAEREIRELTGEGADGFDGRGGRKGGGKGRREN